MKFYSYFEKESLNMRLHVLWDIAPILAFGTFSVLGTFTIAYIFPFIAASIGSKYLKRHILFIFFSEKSLVEFEVLDFISCLQFWHSLLFFLFLTCFSLYCRLNFVRFSFSNYIFMITELVL